MLGHEASLYREAWPVFDPGLTVRDEVEVVVQLNGKVKEKIFVPSGLSREAFQDAVLELPGIARLLEGKEVVKMIPVPDKLLNIVVR